MTHLPQFPIAPSQPADSVPSGGFPSCIDRRAFLGGSALFAVGALLATACGDGQIGATTGPSGTGSITVNPADYAALTTVGGIARINGTNTPIALVRSTSTTYRAFSMICTHQGTTINIVNNATSFRCPNHAATFASTGAWTGGQRASRLNELTVAAGATTGTLQISY